MFPLWTGSRGLEIATSLKGAYYKVCKGMTLQVIMVSDIEATKC